MMVLGQLDWSAIRLIASYFIAISGIVVGHFSIPIALGAVWWRHRIELGRVRLIVAFSSLFGLSGVMAWLDSTMYDRMGNTNLYAALVLGVAVLRAFAAVYIIRLTLWVMSETLAAKDRETAHKLARLAAELRQANEELDSAWRNEMEGRSQALRLAEEKEMMVRSLERMLATRATLSQIEETVKSYKDRS